MPILIWDNIGDRTYETGLDRGVLYLSDGSAVPWNGLTSIIEHVDKETSPVYFDGRKINNVVILGSFSATMKAITYPDEFLEIEGLSSIKDGVVIGDQPPLFFSLCYRTKIGNDVDGDFAGYKIHIIYNLIAIPSDKTHISVNDTPSLSEFEWKITAIPEEIPGFSPTAHIIIDSRKTEPFLLEEIEEKLYGSASLPASLMPMSELVNYISNWFMIKITDHGDGTWSAETDIEEFIEVNEIEQSFTINEANAIFLDPETYEITDTTGIGE